MAANIYTDNIRQHVKWSYSDLLRFQAYSYQLSGLQNYPSPKDVMNFWLSMGYMVEKELEL